MKLSKQTRERQKLYKCPEGISPSPTNEEKELAGRG